MRTPRTWRMARPASSIRSLCAIGRLRSLPDAESAGDIRVGGPALVVADASGDVCIGGSIVHMPFPHSDTLVE